MMWPGRNAGHLNERHMVPKYALRPSAIQQDQTKGEYVHVSDYTAALNTAVAAIREFQFTLQVIPSESWNL